MSKHNEYQEYDGSAEAEDTWGILKSVAIVVAVVIVLSYLFGVNFG